MKELVCFIQVSLGERKPPLSHQPAQLSPTQSEPAPATSRGEGGWWEIAESTWAGLCSGWRSAVRIGFLVLGVYFSLAVSPASGRTGSGTCCSMSCCTGKEVCCCTGETGEPADFPGAATDPTTGRQSFGIGAAEPVFSAGCGCASAAVSGTEPQPEGIQGHSPADLFSRSPKVRPLFSLRQPKPSTCQTSTARAPPQIC